MHEPKLWTAVPCAKCDRGALCQTYTEVRGDVKFEALPRMVKLVQFS